MRKILGAWVFVVAAGLAIGALGALGNQIFMGGPGGAAWRTMSGDATMTNAGVITISAGAVTNSKLANASTTVNGQTCTLGSSCTVTAAATSLAVGSTTITAGTNGHVEYNNSGVLGELATIGSGSVFLTSDSNVAFLDAIQTWTATQSFNNGKLLLNGASSGASTLEAPATGGGTVTFMAGSDTVAGLGTAQTFSAANNFAEVHGTTETVTLSSNNYNAVVADCGKVKLLPTGTAPTVTLPNINPTSGSCTITFVTTAAKSYLFNVASGGTKQNSQGFYNTRGTAAGDTVSVILTVPSASAATWNISGDVTS